MAEKLDTSISHLDKTGDAEVRGVNNGALAVATMQQKPRLLSKSMIKVRYLEHILVKVVYIGS